jgi:hypothetical protein
MQSLGLPNPTVMAGSSGTRLLQFEMREEASDNLWFAITRNASGNAKYRLAPQLGYALARL